MNGEKAPRLREQARGERDLRVRLAANPADLDAAQRLRFEVFHLEMGARLPAEALALERDIDPYDAIADHLLVEDHAGASPQIVGTYRLLRQPVAEAGSGFYSAGEYDLEPILQHARSAGTTLLELGRSCVAPAYRDSGTIQLLWRGIADYLSRHEIGHMFGCASFHGTDPADHAAALAYLHHHHLAPAPLRARARAQARLDMDLQPIGSYDPRLAMRALPPLIKAYLRVGAQIGDGAWIDHDFNSIDVLVIVPVTAIAARYSERFALARIAA